MRIKNTGLNECCKQLQKALGTPDKTTKINSLVNRILNIKTSKAKTDTLTSHIDTFNKLKPTLPNTELQEKIQSVINKLKTFQPSDSKSTSPATVKSTTLVNLRGINNAGGSDCFLIALCQMLATGALQKYLVDQLPQPLWELLVATNKNSQAIRAALIEHTSFGKLIPRDADPMKSQLDATEVLTALLEAIDRPPPKSTPQSTLPVNPNPIPKKSSEPLPPKKPTPSINTPPTPSLWKRCFAKITGCLQQIRNWFYAIYCKITGTTPKNQEPIKLPSPIFNPTPSSPIVNYTPEIPTSKIKNKESYISYKDNPLTIRTVDQISRFTSSARTNLISNTSIPHMSDGEKWLPLSFTTSNDNSSPFTQMFKSHFQQEEIDNTHPHDGAPAEYIIKKTLLSALPEYMLLSFKRFEYDNKTHIKQKNCTPVKDIPLEWELPSDVLLSKPTSQENKYELTSFLCHEGTSLDSGHYVAYRKESDGWYYFDDGMTPELVSDEQIKIASEDAFLVFYERKKNP